MNDPIWGEILLAYAPAIKDITGTFNFVVKLWALSHFTIIKLTRR
ncbi:hypothetical protein ACTLMX_000237 [Escherichia coli]